jgi:hypothetical protein
MAHDGQAYGPVDENALADWIHQGRVDAQTLLHCHETNARVQAGSVAALQPMLGLSRQQSDQLLQSAAAPGYAQPQTGYAGPGVGMPMSYATPGNYVAGYPQQHNLTPFPTAAAVLLCMFVPFFSLIYYGMVHGNLPKRRPDDPSAGKAIGFMFIPFFNIYWTCFFWVRLCTRIDDERARAGLAPAAPRGLVIAVLWCHLGLMIPFLNILVAIAILVMLLLAAIQLQESINSLCAATGRT